jgi:L-ribulose-5-phosphate 4-epimerase
MIQQTLDECVLLNKQLETNRLVKLTWGNASLRDGDVLVIKPSGVPFEYLKSEDMSVIEISTGNCIAGKKPSVDLPFHLELYRNFKDVNCVVHTHSTYATAWAQANKSIPCIGTTHADYFSGDIPVCSCVSETELEQYETNIGKRIVQFYSENNLTSVCSPAILIPYHGCVVMADSGKKGIETAVVLEEVAKLAFLTFCINDKIGELPKQMFDKHFNRKNGRNKYYGQ